MCFSYIHDRALSYKRQTCPVKLFTPLNLFVFNGAVPSAISPGSLQSLQIRHCFLDCRDEICDMILEDHHTVGHILALLVLVRIGNGQVVAPIAGLFDIEKIILSSRAQHFGEDLVLILGLGFCLVLILVVRFVSNLIKSTFRQFA